MEIKNKFLSRKNRKKRKKRGWFSSLFSFFSSGKKDNQVEIEPVVLAEEPAAKNVSVSEREDGEGIAAVSPAPASTPEKTAVETQTTSTPEKDEKKRWFSFSFDDEKKDEEVKSEPVPSEEENAEENVPDAAPEIEGELSLDTPDTLPKYWEKIELGDLQYTARKDTKKLIRSICQFIILGVTFYLFAGMFLTMTTYRPYDAQAEGLSREKGFIALSYIGTQRLTTHNLFGLSQLRQHLTALKDAGYVTITQQDIINYYQNGQPLPEKALFLMFEDARRNTVIFSQKILEELNFKATMLGYPERFFLKDPRFLTTDEMGDLEDTTFWELGTNGYRYEFINVYDRYGNYFKEMNLSEHSDVAPYLDLHLPKKRQNHYLMDYLRDENGAPAETYDDMRERISYDYRAIHDIYTKQVKSMPKLYVLMHPNTGRFGEHSDVSAINEYWIKELFKINFNRAGTSFNKPSDKIYDLTRMQPQAWWSVNHLLVRLGRDLNQKFEFILGDPAKAAEWSILDGTAEFQEKTIILTSFHRGLSRLKLKDSDQFQDIYLDVRVLGNRLGMQKIYLRADENNGFSRFLAVCFLDNYLYITERAGDVERELFKLNLDRHDGIAPWSVPEDKKRAEISELEAYMKYAPSKDRAKFYADKIEEKKLEVVPTIDDGAPEYVPVISADARGNRKLFVSLRGDKISLSVDDKEVVTDLQVTNTGAGGFYLESGWSGKYWADEVYDGVFEDLAITENTGIERKKEKVLFDVKPQGSEAIKFEASVIWDHIVEFFITKVI